MSNEPLHTAPEEQFVEENINEITLNDATEKTVNEEIVANEQQESRIAAEQETAVATDQEQEIVIVNEQQEPETAVATEQKQEVVVDEQEDGLTSEEVAEYEGAVLQYANMNKEELLATLERIVSSADIGIEVLRKEVEAIKSAFYKLLKQEQAAHAATADEGEKPAEESENEFETIFKRIYTAYKNKRNQHLVQLDKQKEQNLADKLQIIEELKSLLEKQEDLNQTFPAFRALQQRWKDIGIVPQSQAKNLWETYHHYVEKFYDYVKINNELRDLDLKKNLEAKIALCEKTEALLLEPSITNAFVKLQKYHDAWREIGPIARESREQIWERFKSATAATNKKHQEYFEQQKEEQKKNLETKQALCEKAEEIAASELKTNRAWNDVSKALDDLQKVWKTIGFATKKENTRIFERFRAACDKFYQNKREFYAAFKSDMQQNFELKEALCQQAEAFKESTEWKKASDKLIALQKQWKEIGPVPRKQSDALWKRFRNACDTFFANRGTHFSGVDNQYEGNLQKKEALIDEVNAYVPSGNPEENLAALQSFQRRWTEIGFVPIKEKERIQNAYRAAIDKQFLTLRISDADKKLIRFKNRIEEMQGGSSKKGDRALRSEREKFIQKLRSLESDIALWENNIGFFTKSKNADALIADVRQKIENAKAEMTVLEEKIKLIDKQYE